MSRFAERLVTVENLNSLQVEIPEYNNSQPGKSKIVSHLLLLISRFFIPSLLPSSWMVQMNLSPGRSPKDFQSLVHSILQYVYLPSSHRKLSKFLSVLPKFPTKAVVPSWFMFPSLDALDKRKKSLEDYLKELVLIPAVVRSKDFQDFFGFETFSLRLVDNAHPDLLFSLNDPRFGINAIEYDAAENLLISACEDPHIVSRVNSYITNTKMPWEGKSPSEVPIGVLNIWKRDQRGNWDVSAFQEYSCQCTAVFWDAPRQRVFAGLETGLIKVYELSAPFNHLRHVKDIPVHEARVSAIIYDSASDTLISCSRDKTIGIYNVTRDVLVSSLRISETWLMSMCYDKANQRLFVGAYSGAISIFDLSKQRLKPVHTLTDHQDCVRCLDYRADQMYLFSGCFDSKSLIWKIGMPGKEHTRSRAVACLRGGPNSKVKAVLFCPANRMVITGHHNGMMAFWSTANAKVEFVVNRHDASIVVLKWMAEEEMLLSGSRDGNIRFWKFKSGDIGKVEEKSVLGSSRVIVEAVDDLPKQKVEKFASIQEVPAHDASIAVEREVEPDILEDDQVQEEAKEEKVQEEVEKENFQEEPQPEKVQEESQPEKVQEENEKDTSDALQDVPLDEPVRKLDKSRKTRNPFGDEEEDDIFG